MDLFLKGHNFPVDVRLILNGIRRNPRRNRKAITGDALFFIGQICGRMVIKYTPHGWKVKKRGDEMRRSDIQLLTHNVNKN
jgi:hypothetical protein